MIGMVVGYVGRGEVTCMNCSCDQVTDLNGRTIVASHAEKGTNHALLALWPPDEVVEY